MMRGDRDNALPSSIEGRLAVWPGEGNGCEKDQPGTRSLFMEGVSVCDSMQLPL